MNNISPTTLIINHVCDIGVNAAIVGGIGYLCARVVKELDPRVGLACGLTAGAISGLFLSKGCNTSSKIVALAACIFAPFKVCQHLELPATFKQALALTSASIVALVAIKMFVDYLSKDNE